MTTIGEKILKSLKDFADSLTRQNRCISNELTILPEYKVTTMKYNPNMQSESIMSRQDYLEACRNENNNFKECYGPILITYIRKPQKLVLPPRKLSNEELINYYKGNFQNTPIGCVVAINIDRDIHFGWSLCHTSKDKFNKVICLNKAINRALSGDGYNQDDLPVTVKPYIERMAVRADKYFFKDRA